MITIKKSSVVWIIVIIMVYAIQSFLPLEIHMYLSRGFTAKLCDTLVLAGCVITLFDILRQKTV